jgi:hypothetical protein
MRIMAFGKIGLRCSFLISYLIAVHLPKLSGIQRLKHVAK